MTITFLCRGKSVAWWFTMLLMVIGLSITSSGGRLSKHSCSSIWKESTWKDWWLLVMEDTKAFLYWERSLHLESLPHLQELLFCWSQLICLNLAALLPQQWVSPLREAVKSNLQAHSFYLECNRVGNQTGQGTGAIWGSFGLKRFWRWDSCDQ